MEIKKKTKVSKKNISSWNFDKKRNKSKKKII